MQGHGDPRRISLGGGGGVCGDAVGCLSQRRQVAKGEEGARGKTQSRKGEMCHRAPMAHAASDSPGPQILLFSASWRLCARRTASLRETNHVSASHGPVRDAVGLGSSRAWMVVSFPVGASQPAIGFLVSDDLMPLGIPSQRPTQFE